MYLIIYIVLLVIIFLLNKRIQGRYFSFATMFSSLWFLFAGLSSLGLYHVRKPSFFIHLYVITFVLIIDLLFFSRKRIKLIVPSGSANVSYEITISRVFAIQLLAIVLSLPLLTTAVILYIESGELSAIRLNFYSPTLFASLLAAVIFKGAPMGLYSVLTIIWSVYSFENNKYKYIWWAIVNCLLLTLMNGGRVAIFDLVIVLVLLIGYSDKNAVTYNKMRRRGVKTAVFGAIILMIIVSMNRGQDIIRSIYVYFSGSFAFLDYILENPEAFDLNNLQYGYVSLSFIIEPFVLMLKYFGWSSLKVPSWHFNNYCQDYYNIGTDNYTVRINNNTTAFFCFIKDFGVIGIVLAALIFGFIVSQLYKKWRSGDTKSGLLFTYFSVVLVSGVMSYRLLGTAFFFSICAIIFCCKKIKGMSIDGIN